MKVTIPTTIIELTDDERLILEKALCIAEELGNDAVRKECVSSLMIRAGFDNAREVGKMRDLVSELREKL
ncbi:MAG: hypothetical protein MUO31_06845 [Thermodesulfovibrionales bacterium]|nr:hypothetical protein [Thermodesulfovibrionales bacterium]